jgi:MFS family permease
MDRLVSRFDPSPRGEVRDLIATPFLSAVAIIAPLLNLAYTGVVFVTTVSLQHDRVPSALIGTAQALIAAGGLLGATLTPYLVGHAQPRLLVIGLSWVMTGTAVACAFMPAGLWIAAPLPLLTLFIPAVNASLFAYQVQVTPDRLHGRVISVLIFLSNLVTPIAPLLAGLLFEHRSPGTLCTVSYGRRPE